MSYITQIATAVPEFGFDQSVLSGFYGNSTDDEAIKRKLKVLAAKSGISTRYSVLADYGAETEDFTFFPQNRFIQPSPSLSQRMAFFRPAALKLSLQAIHKLPHFEAIKGEITHIITVTCTGLFAPGLDIELIQSLALPAATHRSSINFMGCNAAIIALKQAHQICSSQPDACVLVVCTELCTLHFQTIYNEDYLLSNVLFGDGSAALIMRSQPDTRSDCFNAKVLCFHALCIPNSGNEMAWELSETGFIMRLSSYVGDLIKDNIKQMLDQVGLNVQDFDAWAVHPGGKRIVDNFAAALSLTASDLAASYKILDKFGNMSSPTVLFVLQDVLHQLQNEPSEKKIFAAAFGPGLTVETMQLQNA